MENKLCMMVPQGSYGVMKFYGQELGTYLKKNQWDVTINKCIQKDETNESGKHVSFSVDLEGVDNFGKRIVYLWSSPSSLGAKIKELKESDFIFVRDQETKNYLEKRMNLSAHMLPFFGIASKKKKVFSKRRIPVFFPGSYLDENASLNGIKEVYPEVIREIALGCMNWMEKEKNFHLETGIRSYLSQEGIDYSDDMIYSYIEEYGFGIEDYFRRKLRNQLIEFLLKNQISIHVCGVNWNVLQKKLAIQEQKFLYVHEQNLSPKAVADIMGDSKVVLNLSTNLYEGMHERISMAMMNGAICVTAQNEYVMEELKNQDVVELFSWGQYKNLPGRIRKLLQNEDEWTKRSNQAVQLASEKYTVGEFWNHICEWNEGE